MIIIKKIITIIILFAVSCSGCKMRGTEYTATTGEITDQTLEKTILESDVTSGLDETLVLSNVEVETNYITNSDIAEMMLTWEGYVIARPGLLSGADNMNFNMMFDIASVDSYEAFSRISIVHDYVTDTIDDKIYCLVPYHYYNELFSTLFNVEFNPDFIDYSNENIKQSETGDQVYFIYTGQDWGDLQPRYEVIESDTSSMHVHVFFYDWRIEDISEDLDQADFYYSFDRDESYPIGVVITNIRIE